MKILFLNKVSPRFGGGAELRIRKIGKRLAKNGHEIYVVCGKTEPNLPDYEEFEGMKLYYVKTIPEFFFKSKKTSFYLSRIFFYLISPLFIIKFLKKHEVDVIRDSISPIPALGFLSLVRINVPCIVVLHYLFGSLRNWTKMYGFLGFVGYFIEIALKKNKLVYSKIITDGKWLQEYLYPHLGENVVYIPNGVNCNIFRPGDQNNKNSIILLNVGRFVRRKGHLFLIKSMKDLIKEFKNVHLYLVGQGPLLLQMKKLVEEYSLGDYISFVSQVPHEGMPELYRKADIFILPSLTEGMPVVIIEAMASGLPIISTRIPAVKDILSEKNSILVQEDDEKSLYNAMKKLIQNSTLRLKLGKNSRKLAVERYEWDSIADQELQILDSVRSG